MTKKRILLVEDDTDLLFLMNKKLTDEGFEVSAMSTGQQALDFLNNDCPDIAILDILLPDIDGITLLSEMAKNKKLDNLPVIILSNLADQGSLDQVAAVGKFEYLVKAKTDLNELVKHIESKLK
jgi:DNA-binding response OmpR family regulator